MATCAGCSLNYFEVIANFFNKEDSAIKFLKEHCVLPQSVDCPKCKSACSYREDQHLWRCTNFTKIAKSKKRKYCNYSISAYKGTFLEQSCIPVWKILLFINHFLSHNWDHRTVQKCLGLSSKSSVDWRSFCSEVCCNWFENQEAIGGPGVEVEIDETLIVRRKYGRGRVLNQIWLFGGIERVSKKRFVVALTGDIGERRDKATLVPLILKFIKKNSIIYSDSWGAYRGLDDLDSNYTHRMVNHSEHFVHPEDRAVHTQNIERLWLDIKKWCKRPGIRANFLHQYLARYLFITAHEESTVLHQFLKRAAQLYPPQGQPQTEAESSSSA